MNFDIDIARSEKIALVHAMFIKFIITCIYDYYGCMDHMAQTRLKLAATISSH